MLARPFANPNFLIADDALADDIEDQDITSFRRKNNLPWHCYEFRVQGDIVGGPGAGGALCLSPRQVLH